ncbi:hypothetical protein JCM10207_006968 [Rhodosporidiobolus poonsookiae]
MAEAITDDDSPLAQYLRNTDGTDDATPAPSSASTSSSPSPPPSTAPLPRQTSPPRTRSPAAEAATERLKYILATSALLSVKLGDAIQLYPPLDSVSSPSFSRADRGKGKQRAENQDEEDDDDGTQTPKADWPQDWENRGQGWADRGVLGTAEVALGGLVSALKRLSRAGPPLIVLSESTPRAGRRVGAGTGIEEETVQRVEEFVQAAQELDLRIAAALNAIKELECVAHGLGLSDPLPPISRIEARSYAAYLSSSVVPPSAGPSSHTLQATPSRSPRIPSPLVPSPPRFSSGPPPLRSPSLRRALSSALLSALDALDTARASLDALLPSSSALLSSSSAPSSSRSSPSRAASQHTHAASLSELLRHTRQAQLERAEVSSFNDGASSSSSRPASMVFPASPAGPGVGVGAAASDPFHPTESTFGGIERRQPSASSMSEFDLASLPLRRQASLPLRRQASLTLRGAHASSGAHRVRPSLGAVGAFGLGTATGTAPPLGGGAGAGRKKRPASMGGWSGQSSAFRLRGARAESVSGGGSSVPSSPALSAKEVEEEPELALDEPAGDTEGKQADDLAPLLLVSLQDVFEDVHAARQGVLWRLLEALENPCEELEEQDVWTKAGEVFAALQERLREGASAVKVAAAADLAGGQATLRSEGRGRVADQDRTLRQQDKEREKRRRSGFYGCPESGTFSDLYPPSPSSAASPLPATPLHARAPGRPGGVQHALSRLTAGANSSLPSSPTPTRHQAPPASFANFAPSATAAPPRPSHAPPAGACSSAADHTLHALALPVRALQAKLRLLAADLPAALSAPSHALSSMPGDADRLLAAYDSLAPEIDRLAAAFHAGRAELRIALGIEVPVVPREAEEDSVSGPEPLDEQDEADAPPEPESEEPVDPAQGAVYASLDDGAGDVAPEERQALLDAALSLSLLPPSTAGSPLSVAEREEKVFEAVAGPERPRAGANGEKLSREERIRRMKEAREALALGRAVVGSGGSENAGAEGKGGAEQQRRMVGELREVLRELNRERGRPEAGGAA